MSCAPRPPVEANQGSKAADPRPAPSSGCGCGPCTSAPAPQRGAGAGGSSCRCDGCASAPITDADLARNGPPVDLTSVPGIRRRLQSSRRRQFGRVGTRHVEERFNADDERWLQADYLKFEREELGLRYETRHVVRLSEGVLSVESTVAQVELHRTSTYAATPRVGSLEKMPGSFAAGRLCPADDVGSATSSRHIKQRIMRADGLRGSQGRGHQDRDAVDYGGCNGWGETSTYRAQVWPSDIRQALGIEQFRYTSLGSFRGGRASGRNCHDRQLIALHDDGISQGWEVLEAGVEEQYLYEVSYNRSGRMVGTWTTDPGPTKGEHGAEMAAVLIGRGSRDSAVDADTHTGMAPRAGVEVIGYNTSLYPEVLHPDDWNVPGLGDTMWWGFTGPQGVELAATHSVDVFVSSNSRYVRSRYGGDYLASAHVDTCEFDDRSWIRCNSWDEDEVQGSGRSYALALDTAFEDANTQAFLSSGNVGRNCGPTSIEDSQGYVAIGLGRSAHTPVVVGMHKPTVLNGISVFEELLEELGSDSAARVVVLQTYFTARQANCQNPLGPTGDRRQYPLVIGYAPSCGVPIQTLTDGEESTWYSAGQFYSGFLGSSGANASAAGAYVILKEYLETLLGEALSAQILRVHFLNMGDRLGLCTDSGTGRAIPVPASHGMIPHAGYGRPRLRALDPCHFNDGELIYAVTDIYEGEVFELEISYSVSDLMLARKALPTTLGRIQVAGWLEVRLDHLGDDVDPMDRPLVWLELQRQESGDWVTVLETYAGERATTTECAWESGGGYLHYPALIRDPHLSLALDQEWGVAYAPEGGYKYRVVAYAHSVPLGPASTGPVRLHLSILWETGADQSLMKNRSTLQWACPERLVGSLR